VKSRMGMFNNLLSILAAAACFLLGPAATAQPPVPLDHLPVLTLWGGA